MRRPRRDGRAALSAWLCGFAGGATLLCAPRAAAYEAEVDASLDAQFYTLASPWGEPLVRRRRYTETLALSVWNISGPYDPRGPELSFQSRLRLDADLGQDPLERDPTSARYVPGLEEAPLDVMYCYLEGRRFLGGYFGFRLGRQYVIDGLGFWSFDGLLVSVTPGRVLAFEAFAGFEQRGLGVASLGTRRFEAEGVYRGDRSGLENNQWPLFLTEQALAPAAGFALESAGLEFLHSRLSYRKVINRDVVAISPFADAGGGLYYLKGDRTSSERLAYTLRADLATLGALSGGAVYDFYNQFVSELRGQADAYVTARHTVGAGFERYRPTFDGDSIFNWFTQSPISTLDVHARGPLSGAFDGAVTLGARWFETEAAATGDGRDSDDVRSTVDGFADLNVIYRYGAGDVALDVSGETGAVGHRAGADVTARRRFAGGRYEGLAVLSLHDWDDELRTNRNATSFGYVLGGAFLPGPSLFSRSRLGLEWEHTMNRLVGHRFRLLATVDFTVLR